MRIVLLASKQQKEELVPSDTDIAAGLTWSDDVDLLKGIHPTDACIDLLFDDSPERLVRLKQLQPGIIIVNSVLTPLNRLGTDIVRINGWNTFLKRPVIEGAADESLREKATSVFLSINKRVEWVPDIEGFISARVIASIINEAYFAAEEKVSSREEIDTAMLLGTNYPYGPFDWSKKIGIQFVYRLLRQLSATEKRYEPAALLTKEAIT